MLNPDYRDMLSAFSIERVEYLIVGAYALAVHGLPRATGDLDLWIRPTMENAKKAWLALSRFGAPLHDLRQEDLHTTGMVFQIGVTPCRIDILTAIDGVEFDDAWANRVELQIEGLNVTAIGREDLIKNKRITARPQDVADVARLEDQTQ